MSILVNNRGRDLLGVSEKKKGAALNTQKSSFHWHGPRGELSLTKTVRDFQNLTPSLFFGEQSTSSKHEHHHKHPTYPLYITVTGTRDYHNWRYPNVLHGIVFKEE